MDHLQNELKKEFQLERMILFSDAIFAIAITLLTIDLKIPEIPKQIVSDAKLVDALGELIPKFIGFLLSYFIIGIFWILHHRMFGFVVDYDRRLLVLNLVFLIGVVLMPFSTSFYSVYIPRLLKSPVILYVANICLISFASTLLWLHISNPKNKLSQGIHPRFAKYILMRSIGMPAVFLIVALTYLLVQPKVALFITPIISLSLRRVMANAKKKLKNLGALDENLPGKSND
jgi:uncharacterized membrane protein